eukprot:1030165_1
MGSLFPGLHGTEHRAELQESIIHIGKPMVIPICQYIQIESEKRDAVLPLDIIVLCITYLRFIMHSTILRHGEQIRFYELLMKHYQNENIHPSLNIRSKSIQYFHLLYRASSGLNTFDDIDCCHLLPQCINKDHLVMVFRTEYDHVFSLYFGMEFNMRDIGPEQNKRDHVALFLLRSQFIYGDKQQNIDLSSRSCPRIVKLRKGGNIEDVLLKGVLWESGGGWFDAADVQIGLCQTSPHHVSDPRTMDFIGNELCGGYHFESQSQTEYSFRLKEVELFQIC